MAQLNYEYEEMLKVFRCQDLINLLSFAGQSKNGKKSELYDRCVAILRRGNPNFQLKIKELYTRLSAMPGSALYSNFHNPNSNSSTTSNSPDPSAMMNGGNPASLARYPQSIPSTLLANAVGLPYQNANFNTSNNIQQNTNATNSRLNPQFNQTQTNPNMQLRIKFEKLAFFEFIHELHVPIKMQPLHPYMKPFSASFDFSLNLDQVC